ncbi:class I glutamine amidotransferase-like protein [Apiospora hydei]|uniref:Class I glutamine amidotransferase-like protein n=1 Tax=Apiospora hydei TaxID=1337664 RepID=A0ABR1X0H2_9PEZI
MGKQNVVRIGVFIPTECQLLDVACIDIFGTMSHEYMSLVAGLVPQAVIDLAPSGVPGLLGPYRLCQPSDPPYVGHEHPAHASLLEAAVRAGKFEIVLVPGPDPSTVLDAGAAEWLRRQGEVETTDILSICTGILICGEAGLLKGRTACGPRGLQEKIRDRFGPDIVLKGTELRWVQDGRLWSSGGVTNGNDLVAAYARQSQHFPGPVVEVALAMTDTGDRAQKYSQGQTSFVLGMVWNILGAAFLGFWRRK